jgi:transcriptional regulator with XRE-family HTH domain
MKRRRQILGISQARLAEKVGTSTHYIGQIELKNKFPTPEMLERIAAALEIDSPELFSMIALSFPAEAAITFQKAVLADLEKNMREAVEKAVSGLVNV